MACALRDKAISLFNHTFESKPEVYAYAPGRVNFIGEHTDYCEGFVCPLAINYGTAVVGKLVAGNTCRVVSGNIEGMVEFKGDSSLARDENGSWSNYVAGVVSEFVHRFDKSEIGFDMAIVSDVPIGSGLSSSASLEVSVCLFLEQILNVTISPEDRALLCQSAEHTFPQMPCGIMDQFISSCAVKGHLLLIDCRSNKGQIVPMDDPSVSIVVCNSNCKHQLTGSEYPDRVKQCKQAVEVLHAKYPNVASLRDATIEQIEDVKSEMEDVVYRRAIHVVSEDQRVMDCSAALQSRDYAKVGQYLLQSHASLRDNFEVSIPEIDTLVEIAMEQEGVYGARITGGGFGGCIVCFVKTEQAEVVMKALAVEYKRRCGKECTSFVTTPAQGARIMTSYEVDDVAPVCTVSSSCCQECCMKKKYLWIGAAALALAATGLIVMRKRN